MICRFGARLPIRPGWRTKPGDGAWRDYSGTSLTTPDAGTTESPGRKRYPTPATVSRYWSPYIPSFFRSRRMHMSTACWRASGISIQI
jgi:hypothetical protein